MPTRLATLLWVLLAVSVVSQDTIQRQISQRVDSHQQRISRTVTGASPAQQDAYLQVVGHDAEELSTLSASVQSDLQQLRKGLLAKDLNEKLKRMEKLSKKLRREMVQ